MNIYETTTGNDPFQSYVINVNMDFVDNSQKNFLQLHKYDFRGIFVQYPYMGLY